MTNYIERAVIEIKNRGERKHINKLAAIKGKEKRILFYKEFPIIDQFDRDDLFQFIKISEVLHQIQDLNYLQPPKNISFEEAVLYF